MRPLTDVGSRARNSEASVRRASTRRRGRGRSALLCFAALALASQGCDWWPYDARYDPWRCTPLCTGGQLCHEGVCQDAPDDDAGLDVGPETVDPIIDASRDRFPTPVEAGSSALRWTLVITTPTEEAFTDVWSHSSTSTFVVSDLGVVVTYSGAGWSKAPGCGKSLFSVWGNNPSSVYAGGTQNILQWNGIKWLCTPFKPLVVFNGLWGTAWNNMYAASDIGIYRNTGSKWTKEILGSAKFLNAVTGASKVVHVVGKGGVILKSTGSSWSPETSGTTSDLNDVWAISKNDVYAVGAAGTILHYDGSAWTLRKMGDGNDLFGVWASGPNDVYAVGASGTILHYNGKGWTTLSSPRSVTLRAVSGSGPSDVFVVGDKGTILHGLP